MASLGALLVFLAVTAGSAMEASVGQQGSGACNTTVQPLTHPGAGVYNLSVECVEFVVSYLPSPNAMALSSTSPDLLASCYDKRTATIKFIEGLCWFPIFMQAGEETESSAVRRASFSKPLMFLLLCITLVFNASAVYDREGNYIRWEPARNGKGTGRWVRPDDPKDGKSGRQEQRPEQREHGSRGHDQAPRRRRREPEPSLSSDSSDSEEKKQEKREKRKAKKLAALRKLDPSYVDYLKSKSKHEEEDAARKHAAAVAAQLAQWWGPAASAAGSAPLLPPPAPAGPPAPPASESASSAASAMEGRFAVWEAQLKAREELLANKEIEVGKKMSKLDTESGSQETKGAKQKKLLAGKLREFFEIQMRDDQGVGYEAVKDLLKSAEGVTGKAMTAYLQASDVDPIPRTLTERLKVVAKTLCGTEAN